VNVCRIGLSNMHHKAGEGIGRVSENVARGMEFGIRLAGHHLRSKATQGISTLVVNSRQQMGILMNDRTLLIHGVDVVAELAAEMNRWLTAADIGNRVTIVPKADWIIVWLTGIRNSAAQAALQLAQARHDPNLPHTIIRVVLGNVEVAVERADDLA
jgi:hypothetical protein